MRSRQLAERAPLPHNLDHPQQEVRLNLGCGPVQPAGWINVDGSNRAWLASKFNWLDRFLVALHVIPATEFDSSTFYADVARRFPWPDNSVDGIYMGEMLEHFTLDLGERVLRECFRVLRNGGVLRVRVPDNARFWRNYLAEFDEVKQVPRADWGLDHTRWIGMFFRDICVRRPRRWQSLGHFHKWMYDEVSLTMAFEDVGFVEVERMEFLDSRLDGIEDVEVRDDLIVEGVKPFSD